MGLAENKRIIRELYDANNRGDVKGFMAFLDEDVRWTNIGSTRLKCLLLMHWSRPTPRVNSQLCARSEGDICICGRRTRDVLPSVAVRAFQSTSD